MRHRSAFTMIELVMVIVSFGIIATIGAEIITRVYSNYLQTRAINRLQTQTEIVLEQIAQRLQYRIKDTTRAINTTANTTVPLLAATNTDDSVEWLGISNESFLGQGADNAVVVPGWSGLIDMNSTATSLAARTLASPGSRLDDTASILAQISAYPNGAINMTNPAGIVKLPALVFKGPKPSTTAVPYSVDNYYSNNNSNYTIRIAKAAGVNNRFVIPAGDELLDLDEDGFGDLFEQYYLSHSAYAIVPVGAANDFNLTLRYNYRPWEGEQYNDANTPTAVFAEHVSTFRIRQEGDVVRIKLCIHDNNQSGNFDFSACKEKVIY